MHSTHATAFYHALYECGLSYLVMVGYHNIHMGYFGQFAAPLMSDKGIR